MEPGIILVLDQPEPKINRPVLSLRVTPVGVPSKTMMTMDTSTTEYISHQRSPNQTTIKKPSLTLKEDNTADSGICGPPNKSYKPTPILRTIPTRINPTDAANTANAVNAVVVDPDVDDEDPDPMELQTDATALTFLTEWDAFYNDFVQSSTYTLAHSNANSNLQSLADAYDRSTKRPQITPGYSQSLYQLHQVLEELEKVNDQLFQLFAAPTPLPLARRLPKTMTTTRCTD